MFGFTQYGESEIVNLINNFNDSAAEWDEFKPKFLKCIKESVKIPPAHISNSSSTSGVFPTELKIANIFSIVKAHDEMVFTNSRPVPALPVFSKLLETLCMIVLLNISTKARFCISTRLDSKKENQIIWL